MLGRLLDFIPLVGLYVQMSSHSVSWTISCFIIVLQGVLPVLFSYCEHLFLCWKIFSCLYTFMAF